ncbi:putative endopeptidase [Weissella uvarum]|uniref:M13 family metallopeptidase n=1 Tax=Weissella uvarum TaxID=1479233 RepID=UPI0019614245|nr:M13-type metalloendopeptidase [Weissella uvarum]MBM7616855.1 putative endopeptidase [Weissella uvarum]MCM0594693.1 endopeptidase [Weissella uvarum]
MQKANKQDDFYAAINADWQAQATIPEDKPTTGGFNDLNEAIEKLMLETTDQWLAGENVPDDAILQNFVKYHRLASDWDTRNAQGVQPVQDLIEQYRQLDSFEAYNQHLADLELAALPNALPFGIAPDFKDAQTNVLWADSLGTILPDTTYYADVHPQKQELLAKWREVQTKLFKQFGFSDEETADILDKALAFDERVAKHVLSNEEASEITNLYHPYAWDDFVKMAAPLDVTSLVKACIGQVPDQILVSEEAFWQNANDYYSDEAWPLLKAHLLVSIVNSYTGYLSDDIRVLGGEYGRFVSGIPVAKNQRKAAYSLAQSAFDQPLGLWYAHTKFSPEAKADVERMVQTMIDVYKQRLTQIAWLADATKQKAIVKLNAIKPHIGYPEQLPERYAKRVVNDDDTLVTAARKFQKQAVKEAWSRWNQPVDQSEWQMPANMVNAYYDPQQNQIVFPAAILQAPFYDLKQSASENYGGIGAVIAHEISHAFDTNGSSFDEYGNLNNWWTDADFAAFKERTQKVIDQFDGLPIAGTKVNGKLTVSENVADLGGLADALQAAQRDDDFSADAFFTNWARIWRESSRPEYEKMLAAVDVHAPNRYRTNVPVSNFDEFYETYHVEPGDGMYRAPEERVMIW